MTMNFPGMYNKLQYINDLNGETCAGVMAQQLERIDSDALTVGSDGFYRVDYRKLGLKMTTIEMWNLLGVGSVTLH